MSEEVKVETETKPVKKSWFNRVWAAVAGLVIGVAGMFGINQAQVAEIKNDATKAIQEVKATVDAIQNKKYIDAIESGKNAISTLQTITGEVKDAAEIAKDSVEQYKATVVELKAAVDAKDWKKAVEIANGLTKKIIEAIPEDKLEGTTKKVYDLTKEISVGIDEKKYDPVIELVGKLIALFDKKDVAANADVPGAQEAPAAPAETPAN